MAGGWYGDSAAHRQAALLGWANRRGGGMRRYGGNSMHTRRTETLTLEEAAQLRRMRQRAAGKTAPAPRPARPPAAPRAARETRPAPAPAKTAPKPSFFSAKPVWRPRDTRFAGVDPYAAPDPFQARALYGDEQFEGALSNSSVAELRRTARQLGITHVGNDRDTVQRAIMDYVRREPIERTRQRYERARSAAADRFQTSGNSQFPPLNERYGLSAPAPARTKASVAREAAHQRRADSMRANAAIARREGDYRLAERYEARAEEHEQAVTRERGERGRRKAR